MKTMREVVWYVALVVAVLCGEGALSPSSAALIADATPAADAAFTADLEVRLEVPGAFAGVLGVVVNNDANLPPPVGFAVGTASIMFSGPPTSTFGAGRVTFNTGTINGTAGPAPAFGFSFGRSMGTSQSIDLTNLLPPGGPALAETLRGNYTFEIGASAAPAMESASASVGFKIVNVSTGKALFTLDDKNSVSAPPNDSNTVFQVPFTLENSVIIPAGKTMRIDIDPFATGTAIAVPAPSSLTLAGIGSLGLLGYVWRRRRWAIT